MAIPTQILIVGTVVNAGGPGRLVFACDTLVRDNASNDVMSPHEIVVEVAADGEFSVPLSATIDPGFSPTGWTWEVRPHFPNWKKPFLVAVPYNSPGATIQFSSLVEIVADGNGQLYALINHTHEGSGHLHTGVYEPIGTAATAVAGHAAAGDPHPGYLTAAEGGAAFAALGHAHGASMAVKRVKVTSGNVVPQGSPGVWALLTGGPTLSIPAAVGDYVSFEFTSFMYGPSGSTTFLDLAVVVGGNMVRFLSTDTNTPALEGSPSLYGQPSNFKSYGPTFEFVVGAGDLDGGNVTIAFAIKGAGVGTLYASPDYPLRWRAVNHGVVTIV